MKYGIEVQIDTDKIEEARLYQGKKGKYLTMTTFVDTDNKDQYDNNGFISHKQTKEESESKTYTTILGNVKVFWSDDPNFVKPQAAAPQAAPAVTQVSNEPNMDDDIPFN